MATIKERIATSDLGIGIIYGAAKEQTLDDARAQLTRLSALVEAVANVDEEGPGMDMDRNCHYCGRGGTHAADCSFAAMSNALSALRAAGDI
jgi:hypothetical protein